MTIKYKIFLLVSILINFFQIYAQNQLPEVTNVTFNQRLDGSYIVDVYYDVNDPDGDAMTVIMKVSDDNGITWTYSCEQIAGDIGPGITSGTNKHIVWDFGLEHPNEYDDQFKIKITASDTIVMGIPCPGIPTVTYEGKTYNTVLIGDQCWLKENLDLGTMILGSQDQTNNSTIEKYCYDNDPNNCTTYGGLYQWNEAMQYTTVEGTQGICPDGWHIPTLSEFQTLATITGNDGNSLKAIGQGTGGGAGTNTSGFFALLGGYRISNGSFSNLGSGARFWSSTEFDATYTYRLYLYDYNSFINITNANKVLGFSVRCLKD